MKKIRTLRLLDLRISKNCSNFTTDLGNISNYYIVKAS